MKQYKKHIHILHYHIDYVIVMITIIHIDIMIILTIEAIQEAHSQSPSGQEAAPPSLFEKLIIIYYIINMFMMIMAIGEIMMLIMLIDC